MNSKTKPRLGRGLSSLLSTPEERADHQPEPVAPRSHSPIAGSQLPPAAKAPPISLPESSVDLQDPFTVAVREIALDQIVPNPHQPRRQMDESSIAELAASLKSTGLIQPIVLRKVGNQYQLIAGERRWRAAKVAGLATVPAIIREATSAEQAQMALVENVQRENLNPIDRAMAYRTLMSQLGLTQAELAGRMGEERSSVANYVRLLELAEPVQAMVVDGRLSMGHAKLLAGVSDKAEQERLANLVVSQNLSVRNLEKQLQSAKPVTPPPPTTLSISPHLQDLERSLSQQLGLHVQVRSAAKKGRGKVILNYSSLDQFDELMNRLGVRVG